MAKKSKGGLSKLLKLPALVAGGWLVYSHLLADHNVPLPDAVQAERKGIYQR